MGLLKNFVTGSLDAIKPIPPVPVPPALSKVAAPTAAAIARDSAPQPAAQQLLTPEQTPSQFLGVLGAHHMGDEMVKVLAHGMPDREGVAWAAQSSHTVAGNLPPSEITALAAADAWVKNPNDVTKAAAAQAASKGGLRGPGSLAAQAAAWAVVPPSKSALPSAAARQPRLAPHAVSASVLMAAAISANPGIAPAAEPAPVATVPQMAAPVAATALADTPPPEVPAKVRRHMFRSQQPFIAKGVEFASGSSPV